MILYQSLRSLILITRYGAATTSLFSPRFLHSLEPSTKQSVLWMETANEVWKDLQKRYYQGDIFRISDLQEEIYMYKQGDSSISSYFTHLQGLWQELDNFRPVPPCTCQIGCSCNLIPTIRAYKRDDYVIRFLKGHNEQYLAVRSQIMLMKPLPDISEVFSLLIQQERQMGLPIDEPKILMNTSDGANRGRGYGFRGR